MSRDDHRALADGPTGERLDGADEARLLAALRSRDPVAMRLLYERYSESIFRFLYRLSGNDRHLADDLHQETWLAAARHVEHLRGDSDLGAWLFTVARNKHRSWRRATLRGVFDALSGPWGARRRGEGEPVVREEATGMPVPEGLHDLEVALAGLPARFREVLLLVGCEGLDTERAALILHISPQAARQRLSRARASLARALREEP